MQLARLRNHPLAPAVRLSVHALSAENRKTRLSPAEFVRGKGVCDPRSQQPPGGVIYS
jgi:hypothetical protein